MAQDNNDFLSTPIAPIIDTESCEINVALLNLVMKDQFSGLPSEDAATHLNNFVDLCDMQKKKDVLVMPLIQSYTNHTRKRV